MTRASCWRTAISTARSNNSWTEKCKATEVVTNGFTNTGTKGDDVQNPIAVAAVAADGVNSQEYLFISGSMYKVDPANGIADVYPGRLG